MQQQPEHWSERVGKVIAIIAVSFTAGIFAPDAIDLTQWAWGHYVVAAFAGEPERSEPVSCPSTLEVSGAGDASYNGTYNEAGTHNGQPYWKLDGGDRWLFANGEINRWSLNDSLGDTVFVAYNGSESGFASCPHEMDWEASDGPSPAPTVEEGDANGIDEPDHQVDSASCSIESDPPRVQAAIAVEEIIDPTFDPAESLLHWVWTNSATPPTGEQIAAQQDDGGESAADGGTHRLKGGGAQVLDGPDQAFIDAPTGEWFAHAVTEHVEGQDGPGVGIFGDVQSSDGCTMRAIFREEARGAAHVLNTFDESPRGKQRIVYIDVREAARGGRVTRNTFTEHPAGHRHIRNTFTEAPRGHRRVIYIDVREHARGTRHIFGDFIEEAGRGTRRIYNTFRETPTGRRRAIYAVFNETARGTRNVLGQFVEEAGRGLRRVADAAGTQYHLYVGIDQDPDTSGTPDAVSSDDQFAHPLAAADTGQTVTYHLMLLKRNRFGLRWQVGPVKRVTLDDQGAEVIEPPSAPTFTATALEDGRVRIEATYAWQEDAENQRADRWVLWAKVGADPVPGTDTPIATLDQVHGFEVETLEHFADGFAVGADVRVLVRVERSSDGVQSVNDEAVAVTVADLGDSIGRGEQYHGRQHRAT